MEGKLALIDAAYKDVAALLPPAQGESLAHYGLRLGTFGLEHRRRQDQADTACEKLRGLGRAFLAGVRQNPSDPAATPDNVARVYLLAAPLDAANFVKMQTLPLAQFSNWLEVATVGLMSWNDLMGQVLVSRTEELGKPGDRFLAQFAEVDRQIETCALTGLFERLSGKIKGLYGPDRAKFVGATARVSLLRSLLAKKGELYNAFKAARSQLFGLVPLNAGEGQVDYALRIASVCAGSRGKNAALDQAREKVAAAGAAFLSHVFTSITSFKRVNEAQWLAFGGWSEICNVYVHTAALLALGVATPDIVQFDCWLDVAALLLAEGDALSLCFLEGLAAERRVAKNADDDPFPTKDGNDLIAGVKNGVTWDGLAAESAVLKALFEGIEPLPEPNK
jgi:hypothetical protein